jgi:predicted ATPase
MVGRERELATLTSYLDDASLGKGRCVFISGEAGIGKTRLVEEVKKVAEAKGFRVLSASCFYEALAPYLPFLEALKSGGLESLFAEESPRVEGAYLVNDAGLLIKAVLRDETDLDPDVFTSMLNSVSTFVWDTLSKLGSEKTQEKDELNTLGYQDYRILIRRGKLANLVVILKGKEN